MIGHRHGFCETLGFIIHPTEPNRINIPPIRFRLRVHKRIAIDFGGGCKQEPGSFVLCQAERLVGTK